MKILLFGNVSEPPFVNNLLPVVRAFERLGELRVVEPRSIPGFVPTGAARPAPVPPEGVNQGVRDFDPQVVICLGGGLYFPGDVRKRFAPDAILAAFALSDPLGLEASIAIAPSFDLFYTQDPQSVADYRSRGIDVRRCDPATDPVLYRPLDIEKEADVVFFGKWTPFRGEMIARVSRGANVSVYAYPGETRWPVPTHPPAGDPETLCRAVNRARLALEFCAIDDAPPALSGRARISNRAQIAAACGVPVLTDPSDSLVDFFEPDREIEVFRSGSELTAKVAALLRDETRRAELAGRARDRVLRTQTWDVRAAMFLRDLDELRRRRAAS